MLCNWEVHGYRASGVRGSRGPHKASRVSMSLGSACCYLTSFCGQLLSKAGVTATISPDAHLPAELKGTSRSSRPPISPGRDCPQRNVMLGPVQPGSCPTPGVLEAGKDTPGPTAPDDQMERVSVGVLPKRRVSTLRISVATGSPVL